MSVKENSGIDAERMLDVLTDLHLQFRETLTPEEQDELWRRDEAKVDGLAGTIAFDEQLADAEFDYGAVAVAAEQLVHELEEVLGRRERELYAQCLDAFYAAEELSRDPAHAELIPRVEELRKAHLASYGKPVPPRH